MRRLTANGPDQERGAVAVTFALLLVALVGFIALAVDMGATYAKRQELQNAADSAALAAAQECATEGCDGAAAEATKYSEANVRQQVDTVTSSVTYPAGNVVQVDVTGEQEHWFLPVVPFAPDSSTVSAKALAVWGNPTSGTISLPLTFSGCDFEKQGGASGDLVTVKFTKADEGCDWGPDGNVMPGGFAYIGEGTCKVHVDVSGWVPSDSGNNFPSGGEGCGASDIASYVGKVVLLPIFDECATGKKNVEGCPQDAALGSSERLYHVEAFAAFELDGYHFGGSYTYNAPCGGNERCVQGRFVEWVTIEDSWEYQIEDPDAGASVVALIDSRDVENP